MLRKSQTPEIQAEETNFDVLRRDTQWAAQDIFFSPEKGSPPKIWVLERWNCVSLWVTLGSLSAYEDDFGAILRSLRHHFWHVEATLESLFAYDDDFVATLGSFCVHFWHVRAALGAFGRHFRIALRALAAYGNDFGVTLDHFEVSWGICG